MPDFALHREKPAPTKRALRDHLIAERRSLTSADRHKAASAVQHHLQELINELKPSITAAYVPVGTEPGGPDLPGILRPLTRLLLPVLLADGDLDWAYHESALIPGPRGLREPAGPRLGPSAVTAAALVIVPALAVDRSGKRLGRGGGSYDRALARITPKAFTVALLHDGELVDAVPAEAHDRPVHATITPRSGVTLSANSEWTK